MPCVLREVSGILCPSATNRSRRVAAVAPARPCRTGRPSPAASANPAERALAEGWRDRISQWFFTAPDGIVVEGNGIPPHVTISTSPTDFAAGVDPVLDYAEAWAAQPEVRRGPVRPGAPGFAANETGRPEAAVLEW